MNFSTPDSQLSASTPLLVAKDLRRSFKIGARTIEVLRGISTEIARGEAVFLCGASGAGKTTLLYTLSREWAQATILDSGSARMGTVHRLCN